MARRRGGSWFGELTCPPPLSKRTVEASSPQAFYEASSWVSLCPRVPITRFGQDIDGSIFIAVEHQSTRGTHMRPGGECLLHPLSTARTILTGVLWGDGDDGHIMHDAVGFHPGEEVPPGGIIDACKKDH